MHTQNSYRQQLHSLFPKGVPKELTAALPKDLTQEYVDNIRSRIKLYEGWAPQLLRRRMNIFLSYRSQLQPLSPLPTEEEVTECLQQYQRVESLMINRVWRLFYKLFLEYPEGSEALSNKMYNYVCMMFFISTFGNIIIWSEIESVMFLGSVYTICAALLLNETRKTANPITKYLGLGGIVFCVLIFLSVVLLGLSPTRAEGFLPKLTVGYSILILPLYMRLFFGKPYSAYKDEVLRT